MDEIYKQQLEGFVDDVTNEIKYIDENIRHSHAEIEIHEEALQICYKRRALCEEQLNKVKQQLKEITD